MPVSFWLCLFVIKQYFRHDIFEFIKELLVLLNRKTASISTIFLYGESLEGNGFPFRPYENSLR